MPKPTPDSGQEDAATKSARRRRGASGAALESGGRKGRRTFSAADKLRIVQAADAAVASGERGALGALLREEGIYSSHLSTWRRQLLDRGAQGLSPQKPGRKPKHSEEERELIAARKKIAALEKKLLVANAIIDLQKSARGDGNCTPGLDGSGGEDVIALVEQRDQVVPLVAACIALGVCR